MDKRGAALTLTASSGGRGARDAGARPDVGGAWPVLQPELDHLIAPASPNAPAPTPAPAPAPASAPAPSSAGGRRPPVGPLLSAPHAWLERTTAQLFSETAAKMGEEAHAASVGIAGGSGAGAGEEVARKDAGGALTEGEAQSEGGRALVVCPEHTCNDRERGNGAGGTRPGGVVIEF